ncbi:hypothetical protein LZP85_07460 [Priestia flexa]|uniref:Uncharacterized protein n=1 Tax=Priestia flexa TaxID=86664 RepID=A0A8I1MFT9_9BACI|nr:MULTISPECIES: hypothetical protein [Bacillaceae]KZB92211.1 hypothetical protein A2U94_06375 [Bacillus sp. VT 712]MBN8251497.1 hypothetical protein [Priestia flexa]MBN8434239.1 hypothetical protein [Priestia flexa]MCA0966977.1 hypothetical protein [Priestia flexa]MCA1201180.1 hypothetical protein [Priestia flexa]
MVKAGLFGHYTFVGVLFGCISGLFIEGVVYEEMAVLPLGLFSGLLVGSCVDLYRWWKTPVK